MNRDSINAKSGSVVNTGKIKGNVTTNVKEGHVESPQHRSVSKSALITAIITALATIISGVLIAGSNFFTK